MFNNVELILRCVLDCVVFLSSIKLDLITRRLLINNYWSTTIEDDDDAFVLLL